MSTSGATVVKGLKGVKIADSTISLVDGTAGRLFYRGFDIDDLAEHGSFEEVACLLLYGELPDRSQLSEFRSALLEATALPRPLQDFLAGLPRDVHPMSALRSAVSMAGSCDPAAETESEDGDAECRLRQSVRLIGRTSALAAAIRRLRDGRDPVAPDPELSFAGNLMWMLNGAKPSPDATRAMDLILVLHAEHGLNASTFTARVVAATLSDLYSSITAAIGALKGRLHGGANTAVLRTLKEIGSVDAVPDYVERVRAAKGKFMGFGHAVYKTADPRAKFLKDLSRRVGRETGEPQWYEISEELERHVVDAIGRNCNVDFYSASLQYAMGIPPECFTCIFAASRVAGWCAHVLEQLGDNKIIRPSVNYVGPVDRTWVPLDER